MPAPTPPWPAVAVARSEANRPNVTALSPLPSRPPIRAPGTRRAVRTSRPRRPSPPGPGRAGRAGRTRRGEGLPGEVGRGTGPQSRPDAPASTLPRGERDTRRPSRGLPSLPSRTAGAPPSWAALPRRRRPADARLRGTGAMVPGVSICGNRPRPGPARLVVSGHRSTGLGPRRAYLPDGVVPLAHADLDIARRGGRWSPSQARSGLHAHVFVKGQLISVRYDDRHQSWKLPETRSAAANHLLVRAGPPGGNSVAALHRDAHDGCMRLLSINVGRPRRNTVEANHADRHRQAAGQRPGHGDGPGSQGNRGRRAGG